MNIRPARYHPRLEHAYRHHVVRSLGQAAYYAGSGIAAGLSYLFGKPKDSMVKRKRVPKSWRKIQAKKGTKRRKVVKNDQPTVTKYHERKFTKVSRKLNRRSLKRKNRFIQKVRNVMMKSAGQKSVKAQGSGSGTALAGQQNFIAFDFADGAKSSAGADLGRLTTSIDSGNEKAVTLKLSMREFRFTIQNDNNYNNIIVAGVIPNPIYLRGKVYHVVARKDFDGSTNGYQSLGAAFTTGLADEGTLTAPFGTKLVTTDVDVTPFDAPNFCSHWKILSVEDIMLGPGESIELVTRRSKDRWINGERIIENSAIRGITEGYIIIYKGTLSPITHAPAAVTISTYSTTTYHFEHLVDDLIASGK